MLWSEWVDKAVASAIPGAIDFVKYAEPQKVTVFFVTNRTQAQETATRKNLEVLLGHPLPQPDDTVLTAGEMPGWDSDKTIRRAYVAQRYRIAMIVGDDLGDFVTGARGDAKSRVAVAEKYSSNWGERWVLLPNPAYGSWETSIYGNNFKKSDSQILTDKIGTVQGFK